MIHLHTTANDNTAAAIAAPIVTTTAAPAASTFRFLAVPHAAGIALYWPLTADAQAREALRAAGAVATGIDSQPAGPVTRPTFGAARVVCGRVTFAAFARIVAGGWAVPIHRV